MICNLMLDLETTGTTPGCCILSVALVPFGSEEAGFIPCFYEKISHKLSLDRGFHDDGETLRWWDKQKPDISAEAFSGIRSPESVLESITFYLKGIGEAKELYIWGNGKDFDQPILQEYFHEFNMQVPWSFRNNRCYRDLAASYPMYPKPKILEAHNALADAKAQAQHAEVIITGALAGVRPMFPGVSK